MVFYPSDEVGNSDRGTRRHTPEVVALLMNRVAVDEATGCWLFTGPLVKGYGVVCRGSAYKPKLIYAHRLSYEVHVGPIPEGLVIDHLCQTKACVNPAHLDPCEQRENMRRDEERRTRCRRGLHAWTDENILVLRSGSRTCRECRLDDVMAAAGGAS